RLILPVWRCCFSRAEGCPGFLSGVWTQTVQDLQTSRQTGQSVCVFSISSAPDIKSSRVHCVSIHVFQGFKVGYVVFESSSSIAAAKSHPHDEPLVVSTEQKPVKTGVQKWIQQYTKSIIHPDKLQQTVDSFMQDYDKRQEEEAERQRQEAEKQQEDEEGWVKVTRGHKGAKARPHSEAANQRTLQREARKKRRKELMNFYTWQHKNTQKEHIAELRRKFEEDKQRIALMRAQRKFKPY
uniref:Ribosomal RNA processing 7 homolog A n=1 Tax=Poecilia latipinna TaxID=48699 RepID=A0A3B3U698_9TELE